MKLTFTISLFFLMSFSLMAQMASLQVIHNSPGNAVDIWIDGTQAVTGLDFGAASSYMDVTAGSDIEIGVALSPSTDVTDIVYSTMVNLTDGEEYVAMTQGMMGNMMRPAQISLYGGRSTALAGGVELKIIHGALDLDGVDIGIRGVANKLTNDLGYSEETAYLALPAGNYFVDVYEAGAAVPIVTYNLDLSSYAATAGILFVSGYADPMSGPEVGMFMAFQDGSVVEFPTAELGTLQIINNSVNSVFDIYIDDNLALDNFVFQSASNTIAVFAGNDFKVDIAPENSTSVADAFYSETFVFENFKNNKLFMEGIQGDMNTPFRLNNADGATLNSSASDMVDLYFHHGVTDGPALDLGVRNGAVLTSNVAYGESALFTTDPINFLLELIPTGTTDAFTTHNAPLAGTDGQSYLIYASGLVNNTDATNEFNLVIVTSQGQSFYLEKVKFANVQILHNSPAEMVDVYLNELKLIDAFQFRTATPALELLSNTDYEIAIAPAGTTIDDAIFETTFTPADDANYLVMAEGVVGSTATPFNVKVIPNYRFLSTDDTKVDVLGIHGSPDAPEVDILANGGALIDNLDYGDVSNYISVDPLDYILSVTDADDNTDVIARYQADLTMAAGLAITVYASGLVNADPAFHLWALLLDGSTFPLPLVTSNVEQLGDGIQLRVGPNPASEYGMVHFTAEMEVKSIDLLTFTGQTLRHYETAEMTNASGAYKFDLSDVQAGNYIVKINTSDKSYTSKLVVVR